jgi:predicted dehydrogenase
MKKAILSRRAFLRATAGAAGASLVAGPTLLESETPLAADQAVAPSDRVRFGIVGVGMEGSGLLTTAVQLAGVECVAAADLYDRRHDLAKEIVGKPIRTTRRYKDLLDSKDIDAIIVAVPDHWHKQVVVDAIAAGKDVYCEKPMSHSAADGTAMVAAQKKSDRIVQIGAQRTSSVVSAKAKELLAQGVIGDLNLVEMTFGRNDPNGAWEYPPPPDLSPENLDWDTWLGTAPKRSFDPYTFARWRCWREYGTGVAGDLMVHLISGFQFVMGINEAPRQASAMGGIFRFKDGRNMPDVHTVLFQYGEIPVYVRLSLGCETPEVTTFMGSHGTLEYRGSSVKFSAQQGVDTAPSYYSGSFPAKMRREYEQKWHAENDPVPGKETVDRGISFTSDDYDDLRPHLWNFFQSVRSRKPVVQDAVFGHHAALACHMANESYFRKSRVAWDEAAGEIKSIG